MDPNLIPGPLDVTDDIGLYPLIIHEEMLGQYPYHKRTTYNQDTIKYECPIVGCQACVKYQAIQNGVQKILFIKNVHDHRLGLPAPRMYSSSILREYLRRYFSHDGTQYEALLHAFHELGIPYQNGTIPLMYSQDVESLKMLAYRNDCIKNL